MEYSEIPLDFYLPHDVFQIHIDDLRMSEDRILGPVGHGLYQGFETLNAERIATAASTWGAGWTALHRAADYANDRMVWDEPIGAHQAIQLPLADAYAEMRTA